MTIAFDVSYIQKRRAGLGRHTLELLRALLSADSENEYILHGWSFSLDVDEITRLRKHNIRLRVARIPGFVKRMYWNQLRWPPVEFFTKDFEIFHSSDPFSPPVKKKKTIVTVHDLSYKKFPQFFERQVLRWDKFVWCSVQNAQAIIVPSHQTKSDVLEIFRLNEEKVHIIPVPISSIFTAQGETELDETVKRKFRLKSPFGLFVGTIEPRKNVLSLIKAFEIFHRGQTSELQLVLVGKRGWLCQEVFKAIDNCPARSRILYLDYVSDRELPSIYRAARFFIYPSYYEGYGFPVLEAMASGLPVITSNSSSLKEIAEGTALLIDPSNVDDLLNSIKALTENSQLHAEISKRSLQKAKEFSTGSTAEKVLGLYQSLA